MTSVSAAPSAGAMEDVQAMARYFRGLADPTRLHIVLALLEREHTVAELVEVTGAPRSRISNHLACLKWCRFVESERRGRTMVYRVTDPRVEQLLSQAGRLADDHREHLATCKRIGPDWV